jgi:hypothetical protein
MRPNNLVELFPQDAGQKIFPSLPIDPDVEKTVIEEVLKVVSDYTKNNTQKLKDRIYILPVDLLILNEEALYSPQLLEHTKKNQKVELAIDWITLYHISLQLQTFFGIPTSLVNDRLFELEVEHNKIKYTKTILLMVDKKFYEISRKNSKLDDFVNTTIKKYEQEKQLDGFTNIFENINDFISFICGEIKTQSAFVSMLNGPGMNKLMQINMKAKNLRVNCITNNAVVTYENITAIIENFNKLSGLMKVSTKKLLDICTIRLTAQNDYKKNIDPNTIITVPLEEYMEICGIPPTKPSKDRIRIKVKEDLEFIYNLSLEWSENFGRQTRNFEKMRICDKVGIKNGNIIFDFTKELAIYLINSYVTQYPVILLRVDERNPSIYNIGRKLLLHYSIDGNQSKGIANIISVESLLKNCPDIPTYEEVAATDRALERRIIIPFEKALDALQNESIIEWHYCNSKHVPLTDAQLKNFDYETFVGSYVHFKISNAPDHVQRLEAKKLDALTTKTRNVPISKRR